MVTLNKYADRPNRNWMDFYGLAKDQKPIEKYGTITICNGSTYYEMDTKKVYIYDEENHVWLDT